MSDVKTLTLVCPNLVCGRTLSVPVRQRGKPMRCSECDTVFRVPSQPAQGPAAAQETSREPTQS